MTDTISPKIQTLATLTNNCCHCPVLGQKYLLIFKSCAGMVDITMSHQPTQLFQIIQKSN